MSAPEGGARRLASRVSRGRRALSGRMTSPVTPLSYTAIMKRTPPRTAGSLALKLDFGPSTRPLRGLVGGACPPEMVSVRGQFCIDRFEASLVDVDAEHLVHLRGDQHHRGLAVAHGDGTTGQFKAGELRLLGLFASQAAIALENARLHKEALEKQAMERDLELAATIQREILPKSIPEIPGLDLAALSRPARQVGGDYHAFVHRDGVLTVVVADVSGKSMPAALLVSALHAALQLLFAEGRELGDIATELNKHVHRWSAENKFITMIMASIDQETDTIRYVNAGHNPPMLIKPDGDYRYVEYGDMPLGMFRDARYHQHFIRFEQGQVMVIYTDGITEAANADGEEYGKDRFADSVLECIDLPAKKMIDHIRKGVADFTERKFLDDDGTLFILKAL